VRGVVFEGARYTTRSAFDPVVTRLGDSDEPLGQETVITGAQWWPSQLVSLSRLETLAGSQQRLVVLPGQYRGEDARQRTYEQVQVSLYVSTLDDWQAPKITDITHTIGGASATIGVKVADDTGICRVLVTYTDGQGEWKSLDLTASGGDTWHGTLLQAGDMEYFVQAVDEAGNVAVDDKDGTYYAIRTVEDKYIYLPLVLCNHLG
jgi:hypothetical protein